jgi:glucose/arabinose dehydrogenase
MHKTLFVSALTLALAGSGSAFAQSTPGAANPSPPVAANPAPPVAAKSQKADRSALTIDKLTQDLQKAGFSVKVLEDAFLVQAKTKDGNPILMTFGPNGMSALEVSTPKTQALAKGSNGNLTFDTSPKDHNRIREIFSKAPAESKVDHVDFSLTPGTVVPKSVHLAALPQTMVDIEPTWRGNEYFQVGEQIVIVDPQTMKILGVLNA